ncbi:hypothetical protein KGY79_04330 [Candidatus Bipolaricaulota bacterium]|nr:hypothetical protein [Candidatus Bipolaricaulota bacterium]
MDKVLLLLVVAGLVVGVALVSGPLMETKTVSPEEPQEQTEERLSEDTQQDQETDVTYEQKDRTDLSGNVRTLDFKVEETRDDVSYTHRFRVKHPDTEDEDVRIDSTRDDGAERTIILSGSRDEGWVNEFSSSEWTYFSGFAFTRMWQNRGKWYLVYKEEEWQEMEGKEFTIERKSRTARVYNIRVNRDIPNSVFSR